jgi:REP element-mobilizing transposase RayT
VRVGYVRVIARRKLPLDPNGYAHVSSRGVYGRAIYNDDDERELFLALYERWSRKYRWRTLAWALLTNHHHFLVKQEDGDLTRGLRVLHCGYSRRMNAKYGETRKGHLVRHGFYAGPLETAEDVLAVARYIDLNPVRAGLCKRPEDWPYSSYAATVGVREPRPFHDPEALLALLGRPSIAAARHVYRAYVAEELGRPSHVTWSDDGYESAAG